MLDDFIVRAIIAGIGIALVTGPLGCFVVWRRLSFFGDTLAHSALLGVLISITLDINVSLTIFVVASLVAILLLRLERTTNLAGDSLLGLISHSSLAIGLVILGFLSFIRFDVISPPGYKSSFNASLTEFLMKLLLKIILDTDIICLF